MPRGRRPAGEQAMTGAERQARYRARQDVDAAPSPAHPPDRDQAAHGHRPSRPRRWRAAVAELVVAGRIRRLARCLARSHPRRRHRRGSPGDCRPRPRRDPCHRTPARLRARLTPPPIVAPHNRPAHPPPRTPPPAARPGGCTATPHARRSVARVGTVRRARVPSMHYLDDSLLPSQAGVNIGREKGVTFECELTVSAARVVCGSQPVAATSSAVRCMASGRNSMRRLRR